MTHFLLTSIMYNWKIIFIDYVLIFTKMHFGMCVAGWFPNFLPILSTSKCSFTRFDSIGKSLSMPINYIYIYLIIPSFQTDSKKSHKLLWYLSTMILMVGITYNCFRILWMICEWRSRCSRSHWLVICQETN